MVIFTQLLLILNILGLTTTGIVFMYFSNDMTFIAIISTLLIPFIILNFYCYHKISLCKKIGRIDKNFRIWGLFETLYAGILPGLIMMLLTDEHFVKNENFSKVYYDGVEETVEKEEVEEVEQENEKEEVKDELNQNCLNLINRFEKERLSKLETNECLYNLENGRFTFNTLPCEFKSYDLIDGKLIQTYISVKCYLNCDFNESLSLNEQEILTLRFHDNYRIYCLYELNGVKTVRIIKHENYKNYIK